MAKTAKKRGGAAVAAPQQGRIGLGSDGAGHDVQRNPDGGLVLTCPRGDGGLARRVNPQETAPLFKCACGLRWRPVERGDGGYRLQVSL